MKPKVKRTPSDLLDDLTIFIFNLRQNGVKLQQIGALIGKDHSTVLYHLRKYEGLAQFNQEFKNRIKNFNEEYFLKKMDIAKLLKTACFKNAYFCIIYKYSENSGKAID